MNCVQIDKRVRTVDIIEAMFHRPPGANDKWAYHHSGYKEIRKHQRRGTKFTVAWSDDVSTMLNLHGENWYVVPTRALTETEK